jgi:chromosome segregation ATPase
MLSVGEEAWTLNHRGEQESWRRERGVNVLNDKQRDIERQLEAARRRLETACQELRGLLEDQRRLWVAEREAIKADHYARMEAARGEGSIAAVLPAIRAKARRLRDRRESLRHEVWSAEIRVAELERDLAEASLPDAEAAVPKAREALVAFVEEEVPKFEARRKQLESDYEGAWRRVDTLATQKREAELRLHRLQSSGPEHSDILEDI